jgi:predicted metalloprotease with PDZ domain
MLVEMTARAGGQPMKLRMSRSSPGRYAVHEFAKNVSAVEARDGSGHPLDLSRTGVDEWTVAATDGAVSVRYRIFGDRIDGTYLSIDTTHAHINMPAAFMWIEGADSRPITLRLSPPAGSNWKAATQLFATSEPLRFTAPNLQYFMDSPIELSDFLASSFSVTVGSVSPSHFRLVAHGGGSQANLDAFAIEVAAVLREEAAIFGEFPQFEPGEYSFLLDFVPWADWDAMEHRNSTVISIPGVTLSTPQGRQRVLDAVAHEFFHVWNVERIRPAGLEPFDFTRENITCCLWFAEGFTDYYASLVLVRAGASPLPSLSSVNAVVNGSGRVVRSAIEMSEYAPFADAAVAVDTDDSARTFISYYTYGEALGLALDLAIRDWTRGSRSLDDVMRRLWTDFGKNPASTPGIVARPYSLADLRNTVAAVSNDRALVDDFFDRFIEGRAAPDFAALLIRAGLIVRRANPGRGWIGRVPVAEADGGVTIGDDGSGRRGLVPFETPLYRAGVDAGDVITAIDGRPATVAAWNAMGGRAPGTQVALDIRRRDGRTVSAVVVVGEDPALEIVAVERTGTALTDAQRKFRNDWLRSRN